MRWMILALLALLLAGCGYAPAAIEAEAKAAQKRLDTQLEAWQLRTQFEAVPPPYMEGGRATCYLKGYRIGALTPSVSEGRDGSPCDYGVEVAAEIEDFHGKKSQVTLGYTLVWSASSREWQVHGSLEMPKIRPVLIAGWPVYRANGLAMGVCLLTLVLLSLLRGFVPFKIRWWINFAIIALLMLVVLKLEDWAWAPPRWSESRGGYWAGIFFLAMWAYWILFDPASALLGGADEGAVDRLAAHPGFKPKNPTELLAGLYAMDHMPLTTLWFIPGEWILKGIASAIGIGVIILAKVLWANPDMILPVLGIGSTAFLPLLGGMLMRELDPKAHRQRNAEIERYRQANEHAYDYTDGRCPYCGKPCPFYRKTCPSCGKTVAKLVKSASGGASRSDRSEPENVVAMQSDRKPEPDLSPIQLEEQHEAGALPTVTMDRLEPGPKVLGMGTQHPPANPSPKQSNPTEEP